MVIIKETKLAEKNILQISAYNSMGYACYLGDFVIFPNTVREDPVNYLKNLINSTPFNAKAIMFKLSNDPYIFGGWSIEK